MTKEQFLAGDNQTPTEFQERVNDREWRQYRWSAEGIKEINALREMDCYDSPAGDA